MSERRSFPPSGVFVALLSLVLVAAACAEIGEPDLGAAPSTTTTLQENGTATVTVGDDGATQVVTTLPPPSPPRPDGYVPLLVLSTPVGVLAGVTDGVEPLGPPLDTLNAVRAADDFFGGLVVQVDTGEVLWFPAEGAAGEIINDLGGALLDVGFRDGTPEAILTGRENAIDRVQLVTGERLTLTVLDAGRRLEDLSASAGLFALIYSDEQCGGLLFLNSNGEEVDLAGPGPVECPVPRRPAFGEVGLSPDGDAYAYTEIAYRSDGVEESTVLVGREFSSGAELFRFEIGRPGDQITSLSFDGRRVAMLRTSLDEDVPDGLVIIDGTDVERAIPVVDDVASSVTFARLPLTVGAVSDG
jgi:hypothetical protein